jgi:hypothetical protein
MGDRRDDNSGIGYFNSFLFRCRASRPLLFFYFLNLQSSITDLKSFFFRFLDPGFAGMTTPGISGVGLFENWVFGIGIYLSFGFCELDIIEKTPERFVKWHRHLLRFFNAYHCNVIPGEIFGGKVFCS